MIFMTFLWTCFTPFPSFMHTWIKCFYLIWYLLWYNIAERVWIKFLLLIVVSSIFELVASIEPHQDNMLVYHFLCSVITEVKWAVIIKTFNSVCVCVCVHAAYWVLVKLSKGLGTLPLPILGWCLEWRHPWRIYYLLEGYVGLGTCQEWVRKETFVGWLPQTWPAHGAKLRLRDSS